MDKPFSSWVQWDNTMCNPLAPAREQTQSAWQHGYESGFVDGMSRQAQSSVDKAVNDMCRKWQGLTDEERNNLWRDVIGWGDPSHDDEDLMKAIESKLKEKNT